MTNNNQKERKYHGTVRLSEPGKSGNENFLLHNRFLRYFPVLFLVAVISQAFTGCYFFSTEERLPEGPALIKLSADQYPKFYDDMLLAGLNHAVERSLAYLSRIPKERKFAFGVDTFSADHMKVSLERFQRFLSTHPNGRQLNRFIEKNYDVYKSVGGAETGKVLFSGYYEPVLEASMERTGEYSVPIYAPPDDLVSVELSPFSSKFKGERIVGRWTGKTLEPYHDRFEIDFLKALEGKARVLVWVKDPLDAFFLHIQGSGKIYLGDGKSINLHYAAANGRPYRSIGKYLIQEGKIEPEKMSMQKIREYLTDHPEQVREVLSYNPSYVFFEITEKSPLGALGEVLTAGRSLALDRRLFPDGALAFIETKKPVLGSGEKIEAWEDFSRFVLNQDTGGAIRGPGRADLFWGNGQYAKLAAGHMRHLGNLWFPILKPDRAEAIDDWGN